MDTVFDNILPEIQKYINVPYLLTFMLLSYMFKTYLKASLSRIFGNPVKTVNIVLVIAAVIAAPYFYIGQVGWEKLLFTYALGTSLHELVFSWIEKRMKP